MPPPLAVPGDPGVVGPLMIDGYTLTYDPPELPMPTESQTIVHEMLDGGRRSSEPRPSFSGVARESEPFTVTMELDALSKDDRKTMEFIRAGGGHHLVVVWRYICIRYALHAGITRLYLPRKRKCAPHWYAGKTLRPGEGYIVGADILPTLADVDGDPLTVTYATGPVLAAPAAGGIVISKNAETSGVAREFTPMLLGSAPIGGEELTLWTYVTFECLMRPDVRLIGGLGERHVYVFTEC